MHLGLRRRFVLIVGAAVAAPLLLGIFSIWFFGYRYFIQQRGMSFEILAKSIAHSQDNRMQDQVHDLISWTDYANLCDLLKSPGMASSVATALEPEKIDSAWANLRPSEPLLQEILSNPVSRQIKIFQMHNPLYSEILVTDAEGRLVAASNKTSDYWQADEDWWSKAFKQPMGRYVIDNLHYDESAQIHSRDIAFAVYDPSAPGAPPIGVVKGVINIHPLYSSLTVVPSYQKINGQVALPDGRIVARLFGEQIEPLKFRMPEATVREMAAKDSGWFIGSMETGRRDLIGFATVNLSDPSGQLGTGEFKLSKVLIYDDVEVVLAPVRGQLRTITLVGGLSLLLFSTLSILYVDLSLIAPMRLMRQAVDKILNRFEVQNTPSESHRNVLVAHELAREKIKEVEQVHTGGDEMEQLAQGFAIMGRRVLNYHEQLENELEERTQEYAIDLKMARDFQQAFLAREMIRRFDDGDPSSLSLRIDHIYKPALSIGGDFYDVTRIDDQRIGVFIADVMGHGMRSALVTSVLRTLLESLVPQRHSAAEMMRAVNERFHDLMPQTAAQIFATASYLVVDVRQRQMQFTSAGHFSPLFMSRKHATVRMLMDDRDIQPALGLLRESNYQQKTCPIEEGDLVMLFTDGVTEATNSNNDEFGVERLQSILQENMQRTAAELNQLILDALHQHMDTVVSADDICLLSFEALKKERFGHATDRLLSPP